MLNFIFISILIYIVLCYCVQIGMLKFTKFDDRHTFKYLKLNNVYLKFAFKDEILALNLLQDNYRCTCEPKRKHFPVIMFSIPVTPYLSIIATNDKGETLKQTQNKNIPNINQQCSCIYENLERSNIKHLDMSHNNICVDGNGTISLIDFGWITINDTCKYNCKKMKEKGVHISNPTVHVDDNLENTVTGKVESMI
jgi:hypothetical protein